MPTEYCTTSIVGTLSSEPATQSATKKYAWLTPLSGLEFKVVGPNALFSGVHSGDRYEWYGNWRDNLPPNGNLAHVLDASAKSTPSGPDGVAIAQLYGTVTQAPQVYDEFGNKYFLIEADSDPGEPKVLLRVQNNAAYFASAAAVTVGNRLHVGVGSVFLTSGVATVTAGWSV